MPRRCSICTHPEKEAINKALIDGHEAFRPIAARFGLSKSALIRHKRSHLPATLALAQDAHEAAQGDDLLAQLEGLRKEAHAIKDLALGDSEYRTALTGIRELVRIVELMAKVRGELAQEGTVTIKLSAEWIELRTIILQALGPFPDARLALRGVLGGGRGR